MVSVIGDLSGACDLRSYPCALDSLRESQRFGSCTFYWGLNPALQFVAKRKIELVKPFFAKKSGACDWGLNPALVKSPTPNTTY